MIFVELRHDMFQILEKPMKNNRALSIPVAAFSNELKSNYYKAHPPKVFFFFDESPYTIFDMILKELNHSSSGYVGQV